MFSKHSKPAAEPATPQRQPDARTRPATTPASFVAGGILIEGDMATAGDLHLDGTVRGDLNVGFLTLGESGSVTGAIKADTIEVRGRVIGTITARQVKLGATAHVEGDIRHAELSIEAGAHFEGRSLVLEIEEPAPAVPQETLALIATAAE
jgi:cytoskeletal protein CcmA (bactofilin family)